jgi:hypothetical protein
LREATWMQRRKEAKKRMIRIREWKRLRRRKT